MINFHWNDACIYLCYQFIRSMTYTRICVQEWVNFDTPHECKMHLHCTRWPYYQSTESICNAIDMHSNGIRFVAFEKWSTAFFFSLSFSLDSVELLRQYLVMVKRVEATYTRTNIDRLTWLMTIQPLWQYQPFNK